MRIDEWSKFVASVSHDPAAADVLRSKDIGKIVDLAGEKGFNFTAQDVTDATSEIVGDDVLDSVAGGIGGGRYTSPQLP